MTPNEALVESMRRVDELKELPGWVMTFCADCLEAGWPTAGMRAALNKPGDVDPIGIPNPLHAQGERLRWQHVPQMPAKQFWTFVWAMGDIFLVMSEQSKETNEWMEPIRIAFAQQVAYWKTSLIESVVFPATGIVRVETPEGPTGIVSLVVRRLLERGIIIRDAEGIYSAISKAAIDAGIAEYGMCDFCSNSDPKHTILVPDFEYPFEGGQSTGGWAACDDCYTLVRENRRADLLRRSIDHVRGGKFTAGAMKGLHQKFWAVYDSQSDAAGVAAALRQFIDDQIPTPHKLDKITARDKRMEAVRRLTGLTSDEMEALGKGDIAYKDITRKLAEWRKRMGTNKETELQRLAAILSSSQNRPLMPGQVPHWQVALDAKFNAIQRLSQAVGTMNNKAAFYSPEATDLTDPVAVKKMIATAQQTQEFRMLGLSDDVKFLQQAEAYSFNDETMEAIRLGAQKIPHDSPLSAIDTPHSSAGWFWFASPMPVVSSPASPYTHALLWGWEKPDDREPLLRFTTFVQATEGPEKGQFIPATKWRWPLSFTFHEMLALNTQEYREMYGPGKKYESQGWAGEEVTMQAAAEFSLFFLMACVWFRQRILIESDGHIERHARKRLIKEHKLPSPPTVRVIALRKVLRPAVDAPEGEQKTGEGGHKLTVRFICGADTGGFPRMQACGPGGKDRKLIWVYPFPKGPEGAPWKQPDTKVYAVVR